MLRALLLLLVFLVLLFSGVLVLGLLLWWLLSRGAEKKSAPAIEIEVPTGAPATEAPAAEALVAEAVVPEPAEPAEPDDLKHIEGIGPKISSVLQAAGVTTFAQLADTDVGRIEEILEAESPRLRRLADPETWPEQARLAAAGDWEGLAALQGELKGGRRV